MRELVARTGLFSPPYGENPLSHGLRRASSPERGSLVQGKWQLEKLSLRESWRAAPERVLRGEVEVWYKDFDGMAKKFLSPYGDGTVYGGFVGRAVSFSPPYGDGTMRSSSLMVRSPFSPPYGDGTVSKSFINGRNRFSPPYGDGTTTVANISGKVNYSPPYGDGNDRE